MGFFITLYSHSLSFLVQRCSEVAIEEDLILRESNVARNIMHRNWEHANMLAADGGSVENVDWSNEF